MRVVQSKLVAITMIWLITGLVVFSLPLNSTNQQSSKTDNLSLKQTSVALNIAK